MAFEHRQAATQRGEFHPQTVVTLALGTTGRMDVYGELARRLLAWGGSVVP